MISINYFSKQHGRKVVTGLKLMMDLLNACAKKAYIQQKWHTFAENKFDAIEVS